MGMTYLYPPVTVSTLPPIGGATAANQLAEIAELQTLNSTVATETTLSALNGKVPANLTVTSTRLLVDGSGVTQPVSAASLPLPTGAATEAKQNSIITELVAIKTATQLIDDTIADDGGAALAKFQTVGGHTGTTSHAWHVDASGLGRVDVRSSALPTGAATETTLTNVYNELVTSGNEANTNALVLIDEIGAKNETAPATDTASSGLNGRLQRIAQRLTSLIALFPSSIGQKTMANSMAVVLPSDQTVPTQNIAKVASYVQSLTIDGTTQQTFNAPANAKWCKVSAGIDNTVDLMVNFGAVATSTIGMEFQAGRSEDFDAVANISVIAKSAITNQKVSIFWGV